MPSTPAASREQATPPSAGAWLTRGAFALSLALVLARATMLEILRDPLDVAPGSDPVPRGPGAGTSLVLDLVAWLPALLVLTRAVFDRAFRIRATWAHGILLALATWTLLSVLWADDTFAAAVSGFHFLSAAVFLWSTSQLVRSWRRLRVVAGVCLALLLVYGAQALTYRYVERAELRTEWQNNRERHLRERGMEPGTFIAEQFEAKLLRGEMMGFGASPNTFAAVTVLLMVVTMGVVVERRVERDGVAWIVVPVGAMALGACIIFWADSKTAFVTPVLAAGVLATLALFGDRLARRARLAYAGGVVGVLCAGAAVVGHGMVHGSLVIDSMTFRWRYWVGAARVFADHPLLGVGWDNFGLHYLAKRLPVAAEEIRDPHNFVVRFFAELGAIGGVLLLAWMLRLWWELTTRQTAPDDDAPRPARRALPALALLALGAAGLNILATVDFAFPAVGGAGGSAYVVLRVIERLVGGAIVLIAMGVACVRSSSEPILDDRPARWILRAILAALGVFLLHNLVDFSLFEIGPMFLFALLAGAALGMRQGAIAGGGTIPTEPHGAKRSGAKHPAAASGNLPDETAAARAPPSLMSRRVALVVACGLWLTAAGMLTTPVLIAEGQAAAGDELLRAGQLAPAAQAYEDAATALSCNGDYALHAARILAAAGASPGAVRRAFDDAVRANPSNVSYLASRAAFEASLPQPDADRVRADYDRALALDPANVALRLDYAGELERLGPSEQARAQYEKALWFNDQLQPDEVERLAPARLAEVREAIDRLGESMP